ncbi:MAG: hypothetical protein L0H75_09635 [Nitrosospira sp.]|nr:hypothetical protein [Nitrosospira sp.]
MNTFNGGWWRNLSAMPRIGFPDARTDGRQTVRILRLNGAKPGNTRKNRFLSPDWRPAYRGTIAVVGWWGIRFERIDTRYV